MNRESHPPAGTSPLSAAPSAATVVVSAIRGGRGLVQRLAELGIWPGVHLKVIRGGRRGPVVVESRGAQIILGQGMAERVLVRPQAATASQQPPPARHP